MHSPDFQELLDQVRHGRMVRTHSGQVLPGEVFVALPGAGTGAVADGARFIKDAVDRGAAWVVTERDDIDLQAHGPVRVVRVPDGRDALGELARAYFRTGERGPRLVGITGTNGKTTITYLCEHLFTSAGRPSGVLGTVSYRWPGHAEDAPLTTPDCWRLHSMLAAMAESSVDAAFMEVSSHALDQGRAAGLVFDAAAFTNLTQDHLDYHKDFEGYFAAKARLFRDLPRSDKAAVINYEDPFGLRLLRELAAAGRPALGYGLSDPPSGAGEKGGAGFDVLRGEVARSDRNGIGLRLSLNGAHLCGIESPLVGRHNGLNLLTAAGVGLALGLGAGEIAALSTFRGVPGRLERVDNARGLDIFVDYAHTPDALDNVQKALKGAGFKRLLVLFGCGGNRDRAKRPLMGQAVARYADVAILTSDNPRHEDPEAIIADVLPGFSQDGAQSPKAGGNGFRLIVEPDRKRALALAIETMEPGDGLLVAGKGHETYQIIGDVKHPFSDVAVIKDLLG